MREDPTPIGTEYRLDVIAGVAHLITRTPIANLQNRCVVVRAIDEMVPRAAGGKAEAHAGMQMLLTVVGDQHEVTLENIDEFVLPAVSVKEG